jgi:hypothetical protein
LHRVRQRLGDTAHDQLVQLPQKRGERFPGSRRRQNQSVCAGRNRGPAFPLRITRITE